MLTANTLRMLLYLYLGGIKKVVNYSYRDAFVITYNIMLPGAINTQIQRNDTSFTTISTRYKVMQWAGSCMFVTPDLKAIGTTDYI